MKTVFLHARRQNSIGDVTTWISSKIRAWIRIKNICNAHRARHLWWRTTTSLEQWLYGNYLVPCRRRIL